MEGCGLTQCEKWKEVNNDEDCFQDALLV